MSKKRTPVRDRSDKIALSSREATKPKTADHSRNIETKKPRNIYQQGNFQIFPQQAKQIRLYAVQNNMKISEVVRRALKEFFKEF